MQLIMVGLMDWNVAGQRWRKGPWTPEEDMLLTDYVSMHGEGRWSSVARASGLNRSGKSCRLRWVNYLRPGLKKGQITPQEEGIIIELHAIWGNKWSTIARYLPGRTDNEIKNYWRTHFKKKASPSQKQQSKKADAAKQLQEKQQDIDNDSSKVLASAEAIVGGGEKGEELIEAKQEMGSVSPAAMKDGDDDQWLTMMYEDGGAPWPDINNSMMVDGLWGGLWSLDHDPQVMNEQRGKMAIQNQASTNPYGVDFSLYGGGYIY